MKKIIICGATSGLGRAVALQYIKDGNIVGIIGRRSDLLDSLKSENPDKIFVKTIDINDNNANRKLLDLIAEMGGMDVYFHCSGVGFQNVDLDENKEKNTIETNCLGFTRMICAVFNYFANQGCGHIAAISSVAATKGMGAAAAYSASKKFQATYLQALAQLAHMRKIKIAITDIRPGFIATDLLGKNEKYPLLMETEYAAKRIYKAIENTRRLKIIDWRYKILVCLWKLIPQCIWERMNIKTKSKNE